MVPNLRDFSLYGHADAGLRELIRERLANLFKSDLRTEILSASSSKKREEEDKEDPKGLFGGVLFPPILILTSEHFYFQVTKTSGPPLSL